MYPLWQDSLHNHFKAKASDFSHVFNSELGLRVDLSHPLRGVTSVKFEGSLETLDEKPFGVVRKNFVRIYTITNRGRNLLETMPIYDFDGVSDKESLKAHLSAKKEQYPIYTSLIDFFEVLHTGLKGY